MLNKDFLQPFVAPRLEELLKERMPRLYSFFLRFSINESLHVAIYKIISTIVLFNEIFLQSKQRSFAKGEIIAQEERLILLQCSDAIHPWSLSNSAKQIFEISQKILLVKLPLNYLG